MELNSNHLSFDSSHASSVSLSCCQSLCDLLRELPLPKCVHSSSCLSLTSNAVVTHSQQLIHSQLTTQLENALQHARQQLLGENEIQVLSDVSVTSAQSEVNRELSPLLMHLSLKGVMMSSSVTSLANNVYNNNNNNNSAVHESLSLETLDAIQPSIDTHLEFNDSLKLIKELSESNDDVRDQEEELLSSCDTTEDMLYSSLGERVKARQRQQQREDTLNSRQQSIRSNEQLMANPVVVLTHDPLVTSLSDTTSVSARQCVTVVGAEVTSRRSHDVIRKEVKERESEPIRREKQRRHENNNWRREESSRERDRERKRVEISRELQKHCLDSNKSDIVLSFELILNSMLFKDSEMNVNNEFTSEMSFDSKKVNLLMNLSLKLKHTKRMSELEQNVLLSFMSLLSNQMTIWFSKYKHIDSERRQRERDADDSDDRDVDDSDSEQHFWQLLINSSKIALNIMTSANMSSRVTLYEELLEIISQFLSNNLNSKTHVVHETHKKATHTSPKKRPHALPVTMTTVATKRQVIHWTELLELLSEYLSENKCLNDSIVLMITRIALNALFLNCEEMQVISIQVLHQIFGQYVKHRNSILEEVLHGLHRIPVKRASMVTKLVLSLTNSFFDHNRNETVTKPLLQKCLQNCLQTISGFLSQMLKKCFNCASNQSNSENDLKAIFEQLLSDLLKQYLSPTNISAQLLLQIIVKLLIKQNVNQNQKQTNERQLTANKQNQNSLQFRLNSIEFLAQICAKFAKLLSKSDEMEAEVEKVLQQFYDHNIDDNNCEKCLKLLNCYMNCEKLFAQKLILSSLWIKEQKILEIEDKFFSILNDKYDKREILCEETEIDGTTAQLFIKFLEIKCFSTIGRLFDATLSHVTSSLSLTTNTTQRSKSMKSLSQILSNCSLTKSTQLLNRTDLQIAMRSALLDASTSVREATVDLIGRHVLQSQSRELCDKYSELIADRILDTGVSVRKRVIKILRDICLEFPENERNGDLQLKIVRRVADEGEGIRRLVLETCRDLWFRRTVSVRHRVLSLVNVIGQMIQSGIQQLDSSQTHLEALQLLFEQIYRDKQNGSEETEEAIEAMIDFIVKEILSTESVMTSQNQSLDQKLRLLSGIQLISMFSTFCSKLFLKHCDSLQSLLSLSCDTLIDIHFKVKVIQCLERVLHRNQNQQLSQLLLQRIEEDLTKQILQSNQQVLCAGVKCLSVLIRNHTKNHKLSQDLFQKFKTILFVSAQAHTPPHQLISRPKLLRAIYSLGLFLKHFPQITDFQEKSLILDSILRIINEKMGKRSEKELVVKCILSLGFCIESDPKICLKAKVVQLLKRLLSDETEAGSGAGRDVSELYCVQVLTNFRNYLSESIETDDELNKSIEWSRESLKQMSSDEFNDSQSIQSQIIQTFLSPLLAKSLANSQPIRRQACNVIHVIQTGGHVHPLQLVPHLVAMTADDDAAIRSRADHVLHEIEKKYHGFVAMKARAGVKLSLQLCRRLCCHGYRLLDDNSGDVTSRLSTLYHVICTNRQSRRGFITQLLRHFDATLDLNDESVQSSDSVVSEVVCEQQLSVNESMETSLMETSTTSSVTNIQNSHSVTDLETTVDDTFDEIYLMFEMILFFPYNVCDEILYILQQLECIQSVNSTHTSQLFIEMFDLKTEDELETIFDNEDNELVFRQQLEQRHRDGGFAPPHTITQLAKALKCVFLVSFLRKLLKEFYSLKDDKIVDYSATETTKLWEKPIHRRQIESSNLKEVLLKAKPKLRNDSSVEHVLDEFTRFKSVSLTGNDAQISSQFIGHKLFTIVEKRVSSVRESDVKSSESAVNVNLCEQEINEMNDNQKRKLLDSIRLKSCSVSLIDIGLNNDVMNVTTTTSKRKPSLDSSLERNVMTKSDKKSVKVKKEKKKKKKKRKAMTVSSSDSSHSDCCETSECESEDLD